MTRMARPGANGHHRPRQRFLALVAGTIFVLTAALTASADETAADPGKPPIARGFQEIIYFAPKHADVIRFRIRVDGQPFSELWTGAADRVFELLDADGNGILEGKEVDGIPSVKLLRAASAISPESPSAAATTLGTPSGRVTRDELRRYLSPFARHAFAIAFDKRSAEDVPMARGYQPMAVQQLEMASFLMALDSVSSHRAGSLDPARTDELFRRLDSNDDESISAGEISEAAAADKAARNDVSSAAVLDRLMTKLRPIDGDGSRAAACEIDVSLPKRLLETPTIAVRKGKSEGGTKEPDVVSAAAGGDGRVTISLGRLPIELRAAEAPARPVSPRNYYKALFRRADQDGNGYLDANEIKLANLGLSHDECQAMDRDGNGMVFEDEWVAYLELRDILAGHRVTLTFSSVSTDPMKEFDANHDGRLSRAEFARALAAVRSWDVNRDGRISPDEIPQHLVGTFHLGRLEGRATGRSMGRAMAGMSPPPSPAAVGPLWFQKMDRNRDGEVSLREFLGPLSVFRKLDANHDGYLDAREAEAFR